MRRGTTLTMAFLALSSIATFPLSIGAGAASRASDPSCRSGQMTLTVHSVPIKPPNSIIAWYGRVVYKNAGRDCALAASTITVQAETGGATSPRAITKKYLPVAHGSPFIVQHGGSANTWLEVTDNQPKNWKPIVCPPLLVSGLEVGGPWRTWPLKYFALSPAAGVCVAFIIKAGSGSLEPGT